MQSQYNKLAVEAGKCVCIRFRSRKQMKCCNQIIMNDIFGINNYSELPYAMRRFCSTIEKKCDSPIPCITKW